ncbi:hypothetical protein [Alloactinosynnema sp. L-07]|uniref:hypothetical protein n=1 Tax=Alloactinosynnema sp. L-07 TaxID=1653480 RepID=UPI00065EF75A|nr:hypothetical protein [Alloactinosynnema sp. L-07]CRK61872.1 hypothetical protein [Alloactinosynnema sp. L-07]
MGHDWRWEVASDSRAVHDLLRASDEFHAEATGTPVPTRRPESTERHVRAGNVQVAWSADRIAGMFTLTDFAPFDLAEAALPPAHAPLYLQRLVVAPDLLAQGSLVGVRCVRRAVTVATERGADVLRCEANPDLVGSVTVLLASGFVHSGPVHDDGGGRRWIHLHRPLS